MRRPAYPPSACLSGSKTLVQSLQRHSRYMFFYTPESAVFPVTIFASFRAVSSVFSLPLYPLNVAAVLISAALLCIFSFFGDAHHSSYHHATHVVPNHLSSLVLEKTAELFDIVSFTGFGFICIFKLLVNLRGLST